MQLYRDGSVLVQLVSVPVRNLPDLSFVYGLLHLYKKPELSGRSQSAIQDVGFPVQGMHKALLVSAIRFVLSHSNIHYRYCYGFAEKNGVVFHTLPIPALVRAHWEQAPLHIRRGQCWQRRTAAEAAAAVGYQDSL